MIDDVLEAHIKMTNDKENISTSLLRIATALENIHSEMIKSNSQFDTTTIGYSLNNNLERIANTLYAVYNR